MNNFNSIVIFPQRLFSGNLSFMISICKTVPQSNGNLMTQFSQGKGYKGIRAFKTLEFLKNKKKRQKMF